MKAASFGKVDNKIYATVYVTLGIGLTEQDVDNIENQDPHALKNMVEQHFQLDPKDFIPEEARFVPVFIEAMRLRYAQVGRRADNWKQDNLDDDGSIDYRPNCLFTPVWSGGFVVRIDYITGESAAVPPEDKIDHRYRLVDPTSDKNCHFKFEKNKFPLCDYFDEDCGPNKFMLCDRSEMFRDLAETATSRINAAAQAHKALVEAPTVALDKRSTRIRNEALSAAREKAASTPKLRSRTSWSFSPQPALMDVPAAADASSSAGPVVSLVVTSPSDKKKGSAASPRHPRKRQRREAVTDAD
eukprot:4692199-Pyramimonas_sp.AAC.2